MTPPAPPASGTIGANEGRTQALGTWAGRWRDALAALDRLPPIRLPVGPAIPWRYGLPAFVVLAFLVVLVASRPLDRPAVSPSSAGADHAQSTSESSAGSATVPPLGVAEPPGLGVDFADFGLKLAAVLALAYLSLLALKRLGVGGAVPAAGALPPGDTLRLVSSLTLAPNRTLHVVRAPGGKLLLVGSTPSQVNLVADLGERPDLPASAEPASFLQVLSTKLSATRE